MYLIDHHVAHFDVHPTAALTAHRAPLPEDEPLPGDSPSPDEDPIPDPDPVVREPGEAPPPQVVAGML
ncbi:MAG: hypothetical protein V4695_12110 [Pseudomonadota bacterium]